MMPAQDIILPEREHTDPVMLTLVAKPGSGFVGKTTILNGFHLKNGVMRIRCKPYERDGLKKYFGRCYQLFEGEPPTEPEVKKDDGPSEVDAAPVEQPDTEVPSDVRPTGQGPRKKSGPKK